MDKRIILAILLLVAFLGFGKMFADGSTDYVTDETLRIKAIETALPSTCLIRSEAGIGSGVVVGAHLIITAYHVVEDKKVVDVYVYGIDKKLAGAVVRVSGDTDLALIEVNEKLKTVMFSSKIKVGQTIIAIGSPRGLENTVTCGIVSNVCRMLDFSSDILIQIDAPVNPGNSGGAVVNTRGQLLGISNSKADSSFEGVSYVTSVDTIKRFLNK